MTQHSIPVLPRRYFALDLAAGGATNSCQKVAPEASTDARLIETCGKLVDVERKLDRLYTAKRTTAMRERRTELWEAKATSLRGRIVSAQAMTLAGHQARAMAFLAMDRGELLKKANVREHFEGRSLAALICDLLGAPPHHLAVETIGTDGVKTGPAQ